MTEEILGYTNNTRRKHIPCTPAQAATQPLATAAAKKSRSVKKANAVATILEEERLVDEKVHARRTQIAYLSALRSRQAKTDLDSSTDSESDGEEFAPSTIIGLHHKVPCATIPTPIPAIPIPQFAVPASVYSRDVCAAIPTVAAKPQKPKKTPEERRREADARAEVRVCSARQKIAEESMRIDQLADKKIAEKKAERVAYKQEQAKLKAERVKQVADLAEEERKITEHALNAVLRGGWRAKLPTT